MYVTQQVQGMSAAQFNGNAFAGTYARELARLLGMPFNQVQSSLVSSTLLAQTDADADARALQANSNMGGSVTIGSTITTTDMGKALVSQLLSGTAAESREMANFAQRLGVGTVVCMNFAIQTTPVPTAPPTFRPSPLSTNSQGAASLMAVKGATGGMPVTTIIAVVVVLVVVLAAAAYLAYGYMCSSSAKNKAARPSVAEQWNTSPAFQPHIARGQQSQRHSGASRGSIGRQSIELADYRISGYGADDATVNSENPHFGSQRLSFARGGSISSRTGPGSPRYLLSDPSTVGGNPMHGGKNGRINKNQQKL